MGFIREPTLTIEWANPSQKISLQIMSSNTGFWGH